MADGSDRSFQARDFARVAAFLLPFVLKLRGEPGAENDLWLGDVAEHAIEDLEDRDDSVEERVLALGIVRAAVWNVRGIDMHGDARAFERVAEQLRWMNEQEPSHERSELVMWATRVARWHFGRERELERLVEITHSCLGERGVRALLRVATDGVPPWLAEALGAP